jgi:4-hydroxy 2-oxovalerate aldolase
MNTIHELDCTLRDGGYCNNWEFGFENIRKIISGLVDANLDIIECGFLTNKTEYNSEITKFTNLNQIASVIPHNHHEKLFVAMMNYGEYDCGDLPEFDGTTLDGIRVAFHKKDLLNALDDCKIIKSKGYKVCVQAMVSLCYTDNEFLDLINRVNEIEPYAFYIVDSFGMMKRKDLTRLFYMVEHNLKDTIWIGFHSHNNMQLAYSNAQSLVDIQTNRNLIIDSSVYGMGRGAGNLNTELFLDYLNENAGKKYEIQPLLNIIDEILNKFYQKNYWGYSLPNYLSALHYAHPSYAEYLDDKKTLTVESMNEIFDRMDQSKCFEFDKNYIEQVYVKYLETGKVHDAHKGELVAAVKNKTVLLIGPGKSSVDEKEKIIAYSKVPNVVSVSVNYDYSFVTTHFVFLSNLRRFRELALTSRGKCLVTSNIPSEGVYLQTKYQDLLNDIDVVRDNAGLMAAKFFMTMGVSKIVFAGFDGYSHDATDNYAEQKMSVVRGNALLDEINDGMSRVIEQYRKLVNIEFLTKPRHFCFAENN